MRLDQRTNEADQAHAAADRARQDTQLAQGRAADAQRQTQDALARNAQLESQLADLAAKKTDRGLVITLGDVLFGSDQSHLTQNGMRTAQKLADVLQQNPQRTVLVEGFTDSTGGAGYNQQLSERRATAVRSALQDMGIALDRIAVRGYGEGYPVAANDTMQNRQMNRRVEIVLSDASGKIAPR
jgi:outer membrane protein OmpA-like peptidoglycan-associated protein